jgi:hypothetical protein
LALKYASPILLEGLSRVFFNSNINDIFCTKAIHKTPT